MTRSSGLNRLLDDLPEMVNPARTPACLDFLTHEHIRAQALRESRSAYPADWEHGKRILKKLDQIEQHHQQEQVEPLIEYLRDSLSEIQVAAALALGSLGDPAAIDPLLNSFQGETYPFCEGDGSPSEYFYVIAGAATALAQISGEAILDFFITEFQQEKVPQKVEGALVGLAQFTSPRALAILGETLKNDDYHFHRYLAAQLLGCSGHPQAVLPLIQALHDDSWTVQASAAEALGKLRAREAAEVLRSFWQEPDTFMHEAAERERVLEAVAKSLIELGDGPSMRMLETELMSGEPDCQAMVAVALAAHPSRRLRPRLLEILHRASLESDSNWLRQEAAAALDALAGA